VKLLEHFEQLHFYNHKGFSIEVVEVQKEQKGEMCTLVKVFKNEALLSSKNLGCNLQ